jgi:hypothetical protein
MINKKPTGKKPIPRRAAPANPAQEEAPEQPHATARSNEPEDELALQGVETTSYPGENFKRPERAKPEDKAAKRIDFDPHSLLIFAWIGLGLFIAGAVFYFFYSGRTSVDETVKRPETAPVAKSSNSTATDADKKAADGDKKAPAFNTSNPANKAGYQQITAFLQEAYKEQSSLDGEALSAKMLKEAPLTGVDDSDVREYRDKLCEYFRLGKAHPLRPPEATDASAGELVGNKGGMSADGVARQKIEKRYTELAIMLKNRYR